MRDMMHIFQVIITEEFRLLAKKTMIKVRVQIYNTAFS